MRITIILLLTMTVGILPAQNPTEIIRKAEENRRGSESSRATMSMKIVRPDWSREMELKTWSKGEDYSLILVTAPARDRGTAFLKRGNEIWNWQPTIERTIKMPPSMMTQSWMGSDFTNEDLVRQVSLIEDYHHRHLGMDTIRSRKTHKIELIPKEGVPVVWGRILSWIDANRFVELRSEFYDEDDHLVNSMETLKVENINGQWVPTHMEMQPADEEGHKTVVQQRDIEFDIPLQERFFSIQNMKRVE